jgi:hypothetical protein
MENVKGLLTKDNGRFKVEMFVLKDNKLVA